jgi:hypothetical protein
VPLTWCHEGNNCDNCITNGEYAPQHSYGFGISNIVRCIHVGRVHILDFGPHTTLNLYNFTNTGPTAGSGIEKKNQYFNFLNSCFQFAICNFLIQVPMPQRCFLFMGHSLRVHVLIYFTVAIWSRFIFISPQRRA